MFPLYCNQCFRRQKYETSLQLFVSRCGHILCKGCVQETCTICARPFNPVAISKDMPRPMAEYFSSPMKQYQQYKKVVKFHHEQERRLVEHQSSLVTNTKVQNENEGYAKLNDDLSRQVQHERERIRKLREYISYYDRRLEHVRYMVPPTTPHPRPRFPSRNHNVENALVNPVNSSLAKRFSQQIRPNIIYPNSPTLSRNNSNSVTTEEAADLKPTSKKARTPPPLLSFSQHKLLRPQFSSTSSVQIP